MRKKMMPNSIRDGWLYGWKDIANYIGCSTKTAYTYYRKYGMPVVRLPSKKRDKITGNTERIDNWIEQRDFIRQDYEPPDAGFVYFARCEKEGIIKIGTAKNVESRIKDLNLVSPFKIELLASIDGGFKVERELHKRFEKCRIKGEWFNPSKRLVNYIEKIASKK